MVALTRRNSLPGLVAQDGARCDLDLLPVTDAVALLRILIGERSMPTRRPRKRWPSSVPGCRWRCGSIAGELAAARLDIPLAALAGELAGLQDRAELDAGGDPRSALASVFCWPYRYLLPDAAPLFRLLGLHPCPDWNRHTYRSPDRGWQDARATPC